MPAAERRAKLVDAAIRVMARDGVAHTTTRSIVAEADMQIGVFHYCFRSKEELVLEVMETISARSFAAVQEVLTRTTDPNALVRLSVDAYWSHIEANPLEHLLTYELTQYALRQPGQETAARAQYAAYTDGMEQFLNVVAEVGAFTWRSSPRILARYVLAVVEGITFQWLVNHDDEVARALLEMLVQRMQFEAGAGPLAPADDAPAVAAVQDRRRDPGDL